MKKDIRKSIAITLSLLMVILSFPVFPANVYAASTEMDNRETVYYPSSGTSTTISGMFTIPPGNSGQVQSAEFSGSDLILTQGASTDEIGFAKSPNQINLADKNYVWVFNYNPPSNPGNRPSRDGGMALSLIK